MSPRDASIMAVICRFVDMNDEEVDDLLDKLEDQSQRNVALAIAGQVDPKELTEDELAAVAEYKKVNAEKTTRLKREEIKARRNGDLTSMAKNLLNLFEQGKITQNMLLIYGVQGEIPVRHPAGPELTHDQRVARLRDRMGQRLGEDWEEKVGTVPSWLRYRREWCVTGVRWYKDGF